jgi:hypothetical protein
LETADHTLIGVEIAIVSKPEREISHYRQLLAAGYDQVIGVFADEQLLRKTEEALPTAFSPAELEKIRLLPLRKLGALG